MPLENTIFLWPASSVYMAITLKTYLYVQKTNHACLFFNLSLALQSQSSLHIHNLFLKSVLLYSLKIVYKSMHVLFVNMYQHWVYQMH